MDDAGRMRRGERIGDLDAVVERSRFSAQPVPRDHAIERPSRHELHGNEVDALVLRDVVDRDDAGVIERRGGLRLLREATAAIDGPRPCRREGS